MIDLGLFRYLALRMLRWRRPLKRGRPPYLHRPYVNKRNLVKTRQPTRRERLSSTVLTMSLIGHHQSRTNYLACRICHRHRNRRRRKWSPLLNGLTFLQVSRLKFESGIVSLSSSANCSIKMFIVHTGYVYRPSEEQPHIHTHTTHIHSSTPTRIYIFIYIYISIFLISVNSFIYYKLKANFLSVNLGKIGLAFKSHSFTYTNTRISTYT